ncbi:MAG: DNA-directed RNA polymerase [Thermoproteota archaeon]|nr:MAG: DNA-directed RNA polymerase [Candidatus Korarchaeota archaeon]
MYYIVEVEDIGSLKPNELGLDVKSVLLDKFRKRYVGRYFSDIGLVLDVLDVLEYGEGKSIIGSPDIYVKARFNLLSYIPKVQELVEGEIKSVGEYGVTLSMGPVEGFIHISQLGDDIFVQRSDGLYGKKTRATFKRGDIVRARITAVTKPDYTAPLKGEPVIKVSLTCKQPGLGKVAEGRSEE